MTLEKLHEILYGILCAVDDACAAEGVYYMLGGGTMLGAIRHKGFIPWDDDADICLWYEDYPAFKKALEKHLPDYYRLQEPEDISPLFYDFVPRIQDTRYHWHEPTEVDLKYENKQNYVCVDVFFASPSANTAMGIKWQALRHTIVYGLAMGHRVEVHDEKYTPLQKLATKALGGLGKMMPMAFIHQLQHKLSQKKNRNRYKYCKISNDLPKYFSLPYETVWFDVTVQVPFCDRMMPVQRGFHEKMTLQYGNYMEPPKSREDYVQHLNTDET